MTKSNTFVHRSARVADKKLQQQKHKSFLLRRSARLATKKKPHSLKIEEVWVSYPTLVGHYSMYDRYDANQIIKKFVKMGHRIENVFIHNGEKHISIR